MKATIYFYISKDMQKKLLSEGKDAKDRQSIELDLTDQGLIDRAKIDDNGNAEIVIDNYSFHYDENEKWEKEEHLFNFIPEENDLIIFFTEQKIKETRDNEVDEKKKIERDEKEKIKEAEAEKERLEREKEEKAKKDQQEKDQKEIDTFVNQQGSEKLKLRKELGYEYNHLAVNEMIDLIECKYDKLDANDYEAFWIDYPSEEMMKAEKKLLKNRNVVKVYCRLLEKKVNEYVYGDDEKEKIEAFKITYNILGYEKTRYYKFK